MPETKIQVYQDDAGDIPFWEWMKSLPSSSEDDVVEEGEEPNNPYAKCVAAIRRLQTLGHELRRPHADILRENIWELRWRVKTVQYRILYTFVARNTALLLIGCTKEKVVPPKLITKAVTMRDNAKRNPSVHVAQFGE